MSKQMAEIRRLNDALRTTFQGGKIMMTAGVRELGDQLTAQALMRMRQFDGFNADNDPHGEHDFGAFEADGNQFFFKIDYYDLRIEGGSEDASDPAQTTRVLTLMLASEY